MSESVYEFTKNKEKAKTSVRISLSYLTVDKEIDIFLKVLEKQIEELRLKKGEY